MDNLRLDYFKKNPELIIESKEWRTFAVCAKCYAKISLNHNCLNRTVHYFPYYRTGCPGCKYRNNTYLLSLSIESIPILEYPIPHLVIRTRTHVINRTKKSKFGFFTKIVEDCVIETEVLEDNSSKEKQIELIAKIKSGTDFIFEKLRLT
jgi:hypothetical protein